MTTRELVERAVEFLHESRDAPDEELAEVYTPDVVLDFSARVFNPKVYEGYAGLREFRSDALEVWESLTFSELEVVEEGDHLLVLNRVDARARGSGIAMTGQAAGLWTVRDGRLARFRLLFQEKADRDEALAALHAQAGAQGA